MSSCNLPPVMQMLCSRFGRFPEIKFLQFRACARRMRECILTRPFAAALIKKEGKKGTEQSGQRKKKEGKSRQVTTGYFAVALIRTSKKHHFTRFVRDKERREKRRGRLERNGGVRKGRRQNWQEGRQWEEERRNKTAREIPPDLAFPPS